MPDDETIATYDRMVDEYVSITESGDPGRLLKRFMALASSGSADEGSVHRVLDLGCGPGHHAAHMAKAGFLVDASDASAEMVNVAGRTENVTARVETFDETDARIGNLPSHYSGVWASFSLLHARREDVPRYLSSFYVSLRPDGALYVAVKTGEGAKRDTIGRLYTYFEPDELTTLIEQAGFEIDQKELGEEKGMDGVMATWVAIFATKPL